MVYEQNDGIVKVKVSGEKLDGWPIPVGSVVSGNPEASGKLLWQSDDKRTGNGIWACKVGIYNWDYTWDETIYIIEGEVTITDRHNKSIVCGAGDLFFIPIGTKTTWNITKPIRKVFHFRSDEPVDL